MSTQKTLVLIDEQGTRRWSVENSEIPKPAAGELLVKILSTALNPVDWKIEAGNSLFPLSFPAHLGWDAAGTVEEVGEGVTDFTVGDKVFYQGWMTARGSAYQQYSTVPAEITTKVPSNISLDEAASLPVAIGTAVLGMYDTKAALPARGGAGLYPPWKEGGRDKYSGQPILVMGGASSVGQQVIQFARLSGFSPIMTTASKHNEAFLKSLGATHIIDRETPLLQAVHAITKEPVKIVYDAISGADTQAAAAEVLAPRGTFIIVLPPRAEVAEGTEIVHVFGTMWTPAQRPISTSLCKRLSSLLESGEIKPNKIEVIPGGLAGVAAGLEKLKSGKVSATKLVAHPHE